MPVTMFSTGQLVSLLATLILICGEVRGLGDAVVYAVNCGGEAHTDMLGVKYERDDAKHGTNSDYGKQLMIGRVSGQDQILYQTERYHTSTFGYDMPVRGNGNYLLILKFSEVGDNFDNSLHCLTPFSISRFTSMLRT